MVKDFLEHPSAVEQLASTRRKRKGEHIEAKYEKIKITKKSEIITKQLDKIYKCVNTKGVIAAKTSIVYPFGYQI